MSYLNFTKMAAAGNDFIVVDNRKGVVKNAAKTAARLCDRKNAVGADGLLLLEKSKKCDVKMRILNPDGSEAEMCGNGVRCLSKFAVDNRIAKKTHSVETLAGVIESRVAGDVVKAKMAEPKDLRLNFEIGVDGRSERLSFINTGVPHAVKVLDSVSQVDVDCTGRLLRHHAEFAPRGTNADFIAFRGGNAIDIRTYERGVEGETLACGTGSTAGALVAAALKGLRSPVAVHTKGGEVLKIYFSKNGQKFYDVYLEGKVHVSFEGRVLS